MFILVDDLGKIVDIGSTKITSKGYKDYEIEGDFQIGYNYNEKTGKVEKIETIDEQIQKIDKDIKNKILQKYSESDQSNLQRAVSRISSECLFQKRDPTAEEYEKLNEAKETDDFINLCIEEGEKFKRKFSS